MELISENKIGIVKGTVIEEAAENSFKGESALKSKEAGIDEAHDFFDSARDESRHARALKGMLDRYF